MSKIFFDIFFDIFSYFSLEKLPNFRPTHTSQNGTFSINKSRHLWPISSEIDNTQQRQLHLQASKIMDSILSAIESQVDKLYKEKKFKEVEEMFSTFLKEAESEPSEIKARAFNNRGHAKYMQVNFDAAISDYDESLKLDPKLAVAKYNRGTILYRMSKFDQALIDLTAAVEADKDNEEYQEALKKCQAEIK